MTHAVLIERAISKPELPHLLNARAFVGSWWKVVLILRVPAQGRPWESKGIFRLRRYAERWVFLDGLCKQIEPFFGQICGPVFEARMWPQIRGRPTVG